MKVLDVALKDLMRSFRSLLFLFLGLVLPILTTGLFYFAFGGAAGGGEGFELPAVSVSVVNLDQPLARYGGFSAGQILAESLQSEELAAVLAVTEAADAASARSAVDSQEAGVAVIIPADFTAAVFDPEGRSEVEVYADPTLTLGPGIVRGIISQFVDAFAGSKIAAGVVYEQLAERGVDAGPMVLQTVATAYGQWTTGLDGSQGGEAGALFTVQSPSGAEEEPGDAASSVLSLMMAGMLVFYVFFGAGASAESILQEQESGTLPRLFTTPTPHSAILGGKFLSVFALVAVQVTVLLFASSLIFGIEWGEPLPVALVALGTVVVACSFGIFVNSLLKGTGQSGIVFGGLYTLAGMLGMMRVFTAGAAGTTGPIAVISLFVPQGWSVWGWQRLLGEGGAGDVLPVAGVMLALSAAFFVAGVLRFNKRFA